MAGWLVGWLVGLGGGLVKGRPDAQAQSYQVKNYKRSAV